MMQIYYLRSSWVAGLALFAAFLLTFWPTPKRLYTASILWSLGVCLTEGFKAFEAFMQAGFVFAFSANQPFPLFGILPLVFLGISIYAAVLLVPKIDQSKALKMGRMIFLGAWPIGLLLATIPVWLSSEPNPFLRQWPLGVTWLAYPLLWFRIRENYILPPQQSSPELAQPAEIPG